MREVYYTKTKHQTCLHASRSADAARRPTVDRRFCFAAGAALHFSAARPYVGVSGRFRPWLGSMRRSSGAVSRSVTLAGTASTADRLLRTLCSGKAARLGRRCGGLAAEQRGRGPPQPPVRCGGGSSTPMRHPCAIDWAERGLPAGSVPSTAKWAPSSSAAPRAAPWPMAHGGSISARLRCAPAALVLAYSRKVTCRKGL